MSPLALSIHFLQAQPDARLVALAREGHEPAFEALFRRYRKELLAYCRRLQPRSGSAEDALQQTLLQAWRALSGGAEVRKVRPWLYRIAHNVTVNDLRIPLALPQEIPEAASGHEVDQLVEQRLEARAALAGLASLPALQRQVFMSTTLDGASHDEVATALGLSSGAVRGLIYRARATLRAAAAAITPSPILHWAIKRSETSPNAPAIAQALASGGGGAGVAAAIVKGGAVLTLAGAFAGAGGMIVTHGSAQHHRSPARLALSPSAAHAASNAAGIDARAVEIAAITRRSANGNIAGGRRESFDRPDPRGPGGNSRGENHGDSGPIGGGRDGGASGSSDGGSSGGSRGGTDGGSGSGATTASTSSVGGSDGGSGGRSDGGSSGSVDGSTTTSGSGGGTSGGGAGPSSGDQITTATPTSSDGGSRTDGGSSTSSMSSSGSGDATTTSSH